MTCYDRPFGNLQGDTSGQLKPPVDFFPPFSLGNVAVSSYSSGPPAARFPHVSKQEVLTE